MTKLKMPPPLDATFEPIQKAMEAYEKRARQAGGRRLRIAVERNDGLVAARDMPLLPKGEDDALSLRIVERMVKSMLWVYGGFRVTIAGDRGIYEGIAAQYREGGARGFDSAFMARVYQRPFEVLYAESIEDAPREKDHSASVGRHLDGCRIGFDAGGSDRKVSAVIDGQSVYSEEVVWFPKTNSDPNYHREGVLAAFRTAASHMPRVDAIGVSSAGIFVANQARTASLFMSVPIEEQEKHLKNLYIDAARELGESIPLTVCNDGDVTALAGAMSLGEDGILGIAMGTSEAGGYVDENGNIKGWLNELAFVPCDMAGSLADEWSGDYGCGVKYFSQDAVIKLAPAAGIALDEALSPAEKLKLVQAKLAEGHAGARGIFATIGCYLGYTLAFYATFYNIKHVLLMGRVTSGEGGDIVLAKAREVLRLEYPELTMCVNLPDERSRRVGQSVAAASLPSLG